MPGGGRGGLVGTAVAEEPSQVADGAEGHAGGSGSEQNLHKSRVSSLYRSGQDGLKSSFNSTSGS